jgi:hypothetical protein
MASLILNKSQVVLDVVEPGQIRMPEHVQM